MTPSAQACGMRGPSRAQDRGKIADCKVRKVRPKSFANLLTIGRTVYIVWAKENHLTESVRSGFHLGCLECFYGGEVVPMTGSQLASGEGTEPGRVAAISRRS